MEIKAQAKFVRTSPRRTRWVVDLIRGLDVDEAIAQLSFMTKAAAKPVLKLLNSSIANAVNNLKLQRSNLYIKKITVDGGPTLKRWQPRAFGRASPIRKRSSHISIVLAEKVESKEDKNKRREEIVKPKIVETLKTYTKEIAREEKKKEEKTSEIELKKKEIKKQSKGFFKRILQRRTGGK